MNQIAIVILHYGSVDNTQNAIKDLAKKIGIHRLILINNDVQDITTLSKIIKNTSLITNSANRGFAYGVNQAIKLAMSDTKITHILLLNNDLAISSGSLDQLLTTYGKVGTAGIASPVLHHGGGYDWGGKYSKWTGMVKHKNWENKPKTTQKVDHVAGAAMLISRQVIEKIGLFDERFFLYYEDLDFCLRASSAGFTIHINPDVVAEHQVSAASNPIPRLMHQWRSHLLFSSKYFPNQAYPTAFLYDMIFYPLVLLKLSLKKLLKI
ncbi:MAG: glycosyltransferase family 2 protein [bacterium]